MADVDIRDRNTQAGGEKIMRNIEETWKGWIVDVDVHLQLENDPPYLLETYLPKDSDGNIVFQNHDRPGFLVRFNLKDSHKTGFLFPDDPDEALFSAKGSGECPTSGHWAQFTPCEVDPGNTTLLVKNLNESGHEGTFSYSLRLVNNDGDELLLDPGGNNQNGYTQSQ